MAIKTQMAVIGAGPGGYPAAFRAADLGVDVTLIDHEKNPLFVSYGEHSIWPA